jgi:GT2 family glycosyltransferase
VRVLVIDDASPDNTADVATELAGQDARVVFRRHRVNQGHIATYNEGIEWVSADYMLLLSADDYLLPDALSSATQFMDKHPEVGFTCGKAIELIDNDSMASPKITVNTDDKSSWQLYRGSEFIELSGARNIVPTPTAVVRTALLKQVGGYRPELPHTGDMELWLRLAAHSSVGISGDFQAVYRLHKGNMSKTYQVNNWLPDLHQRKAALDCFSQACSEILPDVHDLQRELYKRLSLDAISLASTAFNEKQTNACTKLIEFAIGISPDIKKTYAWQKLAIKRCLGFKTWNALEPLFRQLPFPSK